MIGLLLFTVIVAVQCLDIPQLSYVFTFQPGTYGDTSGQHPQRTATARFVRQVHWIATNCRRNDITYEIVVAMWPVKPGDTMREVDLFQSMKQQNLSLPLDLQLLKLVYVPAELVAREIKNIPPRLFVLEYIGKNIAARRAHGRFIVLGGTDCLAHERFYDWLRTAPTSRGEIYGMHRAMMQDDLACPVDDFDCLRREREAMATRGKVVATSGKTLKNYTLAGTPGFSAGTWFAAAGDFTALTRDAMHDLRGYAELPHRSHVDSLFLYQADAARKRLRLFAEPIVCFHQNHDRGSNIIDGAPIDFEAHHRSFANLTKLGVFSPVNPLHTWGFADVQMPIQIVRNGVIHLES